MSEKEAHQEDKGPEADVIIKPIGEGYRFVTFVII